MSRISKYSVNIARERVAECAKVFFSTMCSESIPHTVQEASKSADWRKTMKAEMDTLEKNEIWKKCELPKRNQWGVSGCLLSNTSRKDS